MSSHVVIKGSKSGIILVLSDEPDFETLKKEVAEKFSTSSAFLGAAAKAITFRGRTMTDSEQSEIIDVIHDNCELSIVCIMEENEQIEKAFQRAVEDSMAVAAAEGGSEDGAGTFYKGNLRSGQVLDMPSSVVVIGDVKPGAKVISKGNVIILGSLKGNVYAGSAGNPNAFVVALDMQPTQIRIADVIARSSDEDTKQMKGKRRLRQKIKEPAKETKIAFLDGENIYIEPLDKNVMGDIHL